MFLTLVKPELLARNAHPGGPRERVQRTRMRKDKCALEKRDRNVSGMTFLSKARVLFSIIAFAKLFLTYQVGLWPINESQPVVLKAPFTAAKTHCAL